MNRQPDLLQSALTMATRGWHIFPCAVNGKQPALRGNWQDRATTDPVQIRSWWASRPYNIGLACGPSGLVVIDLDVPREPGHASGAEALTRLCVEARQPYPRSTFTVRTPSGGSHLYFQAPAHPVPNSASRVAPHVDIRATGGYVVAPGSRIGDRAYAARNSARPVPLPGWLAARLRPQAPSVPVRREVPRISNATARDTAYAMAALRDEAHRVATAVDGTRHDTLNRAAFSLGQLVGSGLLPDSAVTCSLADAARQSGLPERDISRIIHSGMTAGTDRPRVPRQLQGAPRRPQLPRGGPPRLSGPRMAP